MNDIISLVLLIIQLGCAVTFVSLGIAAMVDSPDAGEY